MTEDMTIIAEEAYLAAKEILEKARLEQGELFVVGCSTSEVGGATIGTYSSPELAEMVFGGIYQATQEAGVYLAAQCCEHLCTDSGKRGCGKIWLSHGKCGTSA